MSEETANREKRTSGDGGSDTTKRGRAARDVIRSITGRKQAEEALLESEQRWRSLVESIPDIIMMVDADGTILFINRTVLGFTVEGATGSSVYDYVPPEHHDTMRKQLEAVFEMGEAHDFEIGGAGPFGRASWYFNRIGPVVQDGRVVAATLIATDVSEKRRAEEALRESEERYRDVVQNISEAIYEMDANGRITYITPAAEQAIGYPPSEIVGRPFADFFHPDDLSSAVQGFQRALSGHPTPNQYRLLSRTGEVIWVRSYGRPILEGDRTVGVRGVLTDITESKRAEQAARDSETRFRSTLDNMMEGALIIGFDWRYLYANDAVVRHTSRTKEELLGHTMMEMQPGIENTEEFARLERCMEERIPHRMEWRYAYPDGGTAWFDVSVQPVPEGIFMLFLNITEHKRAEEALRDSEERYRDLAENLNDAIFEFNTSGRMAYVSPGMEKLSGYSASEIIGRSITDLVHPDDLASVTEKVQKRPFGDREPSEYRLLTKSGESRWVRSLGLPMFEGNRVVGFRAVLTDITEHKRAEEALRESEKRYRHLVENINEAIYELDAKGRVAYISPVVEEVAGYSPSEIVGRPATDFLHPDDVSRAAEGLQRAVSGNPTPNEYRLLCKTGEVLWVRSFGRPILEEDRIVGVRGVLTDITERKRAEEELRESEERFRGIFESAFEGIVIHENSVILDANPAFARMYRYQLSELVGKSLLSLTAKESRDLVLQKFRSASQETYEAIALRNDGTTFRAEVIARQRMYKGRRVRVVAVRDITERKRAEQALRESEEKYRDLVENINDIVFALDASGRLTYISPVVTDISGQSPSEMIGRPFTDFVDPDDVPSAIERFQRSLSGDHEPIELRFVSKSGEVHWMLSSGRPIFDGGRVVGLRGVQTDITERKRAEEALRESEERFRQVAATAGEWISEIDAEGRFTYSSPAVKEILGYEPEEVIGKHFYDFYPAEKREQLLAGARRIGAEKRAYSGAIARNVHKDGHTVIVESSGLPILDAEGNVTGYRNVARDVTERTRAEEAVKEGAEAVRWLSDATSDIIMSVRVDGTILTVNAAVERTLGYRAEDMVGKNLAEFVHPEDVPAVRAAAEERLRGSPDNSAVECRVRHSDGAWRTVESIGRISTDNEGEVIPVLSVRDITGRKRAEQAVRESEARYRLLADNVTDIIWTRDLNLRPTYTSPSAARLRGITTEEAMVEELEETLTPASAEVARKTLAEELAIENTNDKDLSRSRTLELEVIRKDGSTIWTEVVVTFLRDQDERAVGILGVTRDITERKQAEQELREAEGRYRSLIEASPDAIALSDLNTNVIMVNDQTAKIHGFDSPEDMIGLSSFDFIAPEDRERAVENARKTLETGTVRNAEYTLLRKDGSRFPAELSASLIVDAEGNPMAFTAVTRDITERRRAEDALRESEARLRAFANAVPDVAFILDENGLYVEVLAAPETKDLLYANGETLRGRRLHDVLPKKTADRFLSVVRKTIETQEPQILEYVLEVQAGRRWFEGRTAPLSLAGENQMVVWVSHDITENKQAEAGRQKVREELDRKADRLAERGNIYGLTFRELVVLELVSAGKADREIATLLGIRPRTVSKHVENIRAKMGASSRTEAGVRAVKEGLLS